MPPKTSALRLPVVRVRQGVGRGLYHQSDRKTTKLYTMSDM